MTTTHSLASVVTAGVLSALALGATAPAWATPIAYYAVLDGASEAPANASPGTGSAYVTYDSATNILSVEVAFRDLVAPNTAAHIHCCTLTPGAGTASVATPTPTFPGFPSGTTAGTYAHAFDLTQQTSFRAGFITDHGGTTAGAEAALAAGLAAGTAYFNIHSSTFPGGEIRGFLQAVPEPASVALLGLGLFGLATSRRRTPR